MFLMNYFWVVTAKKNLYRETSNVRCGTNFKGIVEMNKIIQLYIAINIKSSQSNRNFSIETDTTSVYNFYIRLTLYNQLLRLSLHFAFT